MPWKNTFKQHGRRENVQDASAYVFYTYNYFFSQSVIFAGNCNYLGITDTYDDERILAGIRELDEGAFSQLYNKYYRQLCYYAEKITQNQAASEDIAAESFIKLLRNRYDFQSFSKLRSFLFTITHNAALDFVKTDKRHQQAHEKLGYTADFEEKPYEFARIQAEVLQAVFQEIEQLPPQCREVIRLSFIEGLGVGEISARMGLAYKTVQNQKARGLQLLRTALVKKSIDPLLLVLCLPFLLDK